MSVIVEGHGFSIVHGAVSITQEPISVGIPVFAKEEITQTTQANTGGHTARAATLRKYEPFSHTFPYDPADYTDWQGSSGSLAHVITFPDASTLTVYAEVQSVSEIKQETDGRPTYDVTFLVTNLDDTTETEPSYSGS